MTVLVHSVGATESGSNIHVQNAIVPLSDIPSPPSPYTQVFIITFSFGGTNEGNERANGGLIISFRVRKFRDE